MEENTIKVPKKLHVLGLLTVISLLMVFLTFRHFPDWHALLSIGVFMLLFGHTTWSWFSFTMLQSRDESLKNMK
jgi:hypothetical protein